MLHPKALAAYFFILLTAVLAGFGISEGVTAAIDNGPVYWGPLYIIDAGHGGEDGGATSCTGAKESDINLQIALRLEDLLHLLGKETLMIRTQDISVYTQGETIAAKKVSDLKQRVKIANDHPDAIVLSIHQNTFPESQYSGPQVFYNGHSSSKPLAQQLQSLLNACLAPQSRRMCKSGTGIYLMEKTTIPGLLVECGFLSNPREESLLRDRQYQKKLCCVLAAGIVSLDPGA